MKKILVLMLSFVFVFGLSACDTTELDNEIADLTGQVATLTTEVSDLEGEVTDLEGEVTDLEGEVTDLEAEVTDLEAELADAQLPELPVTVDMSNIDMYLGRPDVQYVDLRNFDDKMASGYIAGFEFIPFFDYLEFSNILVRTDGWNHATANIVSQAELFNLFNDEKAIFLMCGSGTRAGFVKSALEELGYTNVYNVGGISSYAGDNKVLGDSSYMNSPVMSGDFTPGTYFAVDPQTQYTATIVVGEGGYIEDVVFDSLYHGTTKNTLDTNYTLGSGTTWKAEAAELAAYVQANQGFGDITLSIQDISMMDITNVSRHPIYIDHANSPDAVSGVTIGAEGFVLAWNLAIEMAGGTPVAGVFTSEEWVAAHGKAVDYNDGMYTGLSDDGNYLAVVTVEDSIITDIYLDGFNSYGGFWKRNVDETVYPMNVGATAIEVDVEYAEGVTNPATYATQLFQEGFAVTNGSFYRISFTARANDAKDIVVAFGDALDADPWFTDFVPKTTVSVGEHWEEFVIEFQMSEATTVDQGKLVFELATAVETQVYIKGVSLVEITALEGDVVADSEQVLNGNFADETDGVFDNWGTWLGDQYSGQTVSTFEMLEQLTWYEQADELEDAILDNQDWLDSWVINLDLGGHDRFDQVDGVTGVTIGIEGWLEAVTEALDAATPAE